MAYNRVNWQNSPSHSTPLSAENLNVMDEGIKNLDDSMTEATGDISALETEVGEQATTISGLQTTVGEHTADIGNMEDDISDLQTTVSGHTTSIGNLQTAVGTNTTAIGTLANLTTTEKSNLVGAINEVNEDVSDVKEDFTNVFISHINYLEHSTPTDNTVYSRSTAEPFSNNTGKTYPYIKIDAGKTYYFKNLYAYFCVVKYYDNSLDYLSATTGIHEDGTFTAQKNGYIGITISNSSSVGTDFLFTDDLGLYEKTDSVESYYDLKANNFPKTYRIEKNGTGDFTSLVEGIEEACKYMDSTVYVGDGTWDIIDELGDEYLNSVSNTKPGIILKNRIHVIFNSNATVVCNYTGTRADTIQKLSVFNAGEYGFTLENAHISSKNIRYCVHDERASYTDAYTNKYINCVMTQDNTMIDGASVQGFSQCIGGGLGTNGHVIVTGCVFENVNSYYSGAYCPLVTYHNTGAATGRSIVEIVGNYLKGRYSIIRGTWYGTSTEITKFIVHDNSIGYAVQHRAETGTASVENTEMLEWNNVIRNS